MSPYAQELATNRLHALRALMDALRAATTPDECRRCATAILDAPDPCELDDAIKYIPPAGSAHPHNSPQDNPPQTPSAEQSHRAPEPPAPPAPPAPPDPSIVTPEDPRPSPPAKRASDACQRRQPLESPPLPSVAHEMRERLPNLTNIHDLIAPPDLPAQLLTPAADLLARAGAPP